jgi:5,10-methylenetetrahydromethanopterin reductase
MGAMEMWTLQTSSARSVARRAERAEAAGWHGLTVTDSQNLAGDVWVALTAAAGRTSVLGLGSGVTNPVTRHPAVTAAAAAGLAVIAGDRVAVGIGRGDSALAHLGRGPVSPDVLEAYVRAVRTYLAGGSVEFKELEAHGAVAPTVETLGLASVPTASRLAWLRPDEVHVPVEVAATGPLVVAAAARSADRVMFAVGADPTRLQWGIELARHARLKAGLDPVGIDFGAYVNLVAHPDVTVARRLARGSLSTVARFAVMHGTVKGPADEVQRTALEEVHRAYDMTRHTQAGSSQAEVLSDEFVDSYAIVGPAGGCIERLLAMAELGISKVVVIGVSPGSDRETAAVAESTVEQTVLGRI